MSSLYTAFVSGVVFPLHERLKGHDTTRVRRAMERSQWWSPADLHQHQCERLRALMNHAIEHVPYYRGVCAERGVGRDDIRSPADLARLPLLGKDAIRAHTEELKADDAKDLSRFNTGGSTGEPLVFYIGKDRVSHDVAAKWRATRWWGVDIGDPEVVVWGSPIEVGVQDRVRHLRDRVLRTRLLPAFEMSEAQLDEFVASIRRMRPRMLFGYPSALSFIARHAEKRGVDLRTAGVTVAFVTSEKLYDDQRATIERNFACRVANGYGGRDAGFIAHECPEGSMHITDEDIIVETVDAEGHPVAAGETGEIVVTHLATGDFPFVRYRTGDLGVLGSESCACGRGLRVLADIQGRATDLVMASDGTVMHGLALIYVLRDLEEVEAFRIIQESRHSVRVQLVTHVDGEAAGLHERIRSGLRERLGTNVEVNIEPRDVIPRERSGKFRYVVSHIVET